LFKSASSESAGKLLERLSIKAPSELLPARPIRLRVDALRAGSAAEGTRLATRELLLPSDGKQLALAP
jgi:hypothetical protein